MPISPLDEWTARRLGVERLSRSAIRRWQLERLQWTVAWARERSPFYREHCRDLPASAPVHPEDVAVIPLVEHSILRDRGQELVCVSLGDIARVVTVHTSGSSGLPKRLWFTAEDLELTADHFRHGMRALVRPGQRVVVLMPGRAPGSVGALLQEGLGRDGVEAYSYGFVDDCGAVAACIVGFAADSLVGVPGQIVRLARSEAGRRIGPGRVKSVLLSGDHVTPAMRAAIERAWDCAVFEHYGSTEVGLGGAVQCRAHGGLHVREADLFFEVIDPATGRRLPDGEEGELVVTTLTRTGMPLIRYRTGDLIRMATEPCPCGSVLRCVEKVIGREDSVVRLEGGGLLTMMDLDEAVYGVEGVLGFSASLERGPAGERLALKIEVGEGGPAGATADPAGAVRYRVEALPALRYAQVEVSADISDEPGETPPAAKQRFVDAR